jgi:hypothetical protein
VRFRIDSIGYIGVATNSPTSTFVVNGSVALNTRIVSASTTLSATDYAVIDTGSANVTFTLPAANTCTGRVYLIINQASAGTLTTSLSITTAYGVTITTVGSATNVQIISDGAKWRKIN